MENFLAYSFDEIPFVLLVLMIAFTVHEFAHAYAAWKFGDPTAKNMGRVTLNPKHHLDIFGTLLIIIAGFGWARPVPVVRSNFRNPRLMGIIVSLVGPLSNLLLAIIGILISHLLIQFDAYHHMSVGLETAVHLFLYIFIHLNVVLFLFNLLPIPPLDGYRILSDVLPPKYSYQLSKIEPYAIFIFLLIVFINPLYQFTVGPIMELRWDIIHLINSLFMKIFG